MFGGADIYLHAFLTLVLVWGGYSSAFTGF